MVVSRLRRDDILIISPTAKYIHSAFCILNSAFSYSWFAALMISTKSAGFREAPPMRPPSAHPAWAGWGPEGAD